MKSKKENKQTKKGNRMDGYKTLILFSVSKVSWNELPVLALLPGAWAPVIWQALGLPDSLLSLCSCFVL